MELSNIRNLLIHGNVPQAFSDLSAIAPSGIRNDVQLLWSQYNEWHRQNLLTPDTRPEERNRILYATLAFVSDIEAEGTTGMTAQRARNLREVELDLAEGYARLAKIRKKNIIDLFLMWMVQQHPTILSEIMRQEEAFGRAPNLAMLLRKVDLEQFIQAYRLKSKPEDALHYLLKQNGEVERFFSGYFEYRNRQEKFETAYEIEIVRCEKRHSHLLRAGLIGGLIGVLGVEVFSRNMGNIAEHEDKGLEPPSIQVSEENGDDDDDD